MSFRNTYYQNVFTILLTVKTLANVSLIDISLITNKSEHFKICLMVIHGPCFLDVPFIFFVNFSCIFYFSYCSHRYSLLKMVLILCLLMCPADIFSESDSFYFTNVHLFLKHNCKYIAPNSLQLWTFYLIRLT